MSAKMLFNHMKRKKITFAKSSVDQYVLIIVQIKFVQNISPEIYQELL